MISEELLKTVYTAIDSKQDIPRLITGEKSKTGRIIDNKEEYCEIINFGSLPNNTEISTNYKTDDKKIHNFYAIGTSSSNEIIIVPNSAASGNYVNIYFTNNSMKINTNQNRSRFNGYVYIFFTYN